MFMNGHMSKPLNCHLCVFIPAPNKSEYHIVMTIKSYLWYKTMTE